MSGLVEITRDERATRKLARYLSAAGQAVQPKTAGAHAATTLLPPRARAIQKPGRVCRSCTEDPWATFYPNRSSGLLTPGSSNARRAALFSCHPIVNR